MVSPVTYNLLLYLGSYAAQSRFICIIHRDTFVSTKVFLMRGASFVKSKPPLPVHLLVLFFYDQNSSRRLVCNRVLSKVSGPYITVVGASLMKLGIQPLKHQVKPSFL